MTTEEINELRHIIPECDDPELLQSLLEETLAQEQKLKDHRQRIERPLAGRVPPSLAPTIILAASISRLYLLNLRIETRGNF